MATINIYLLWEMLQKYKIFSYFQLQAAASVKTGQGQIRPLPSIKSYIIQKLLVFVPILSKLVFFSFSLLGYNNLLLCHIARLNSGKIILKISNIQYLQNLMRSEISHKIMKLINKMWILIFDDLPENWNPQRIENFVVGKFSW